MIEFFKYLKGYVRIRVTGFSPERFMNLCGNKNLLLWDIGKEGDAYVMSISISGFYQLKPIVKKTGTKVAIIKKYGLPFFIPKIKKRKFFLVGFMMAVAFWVWTTGFIWAINIQGNYSITSDVIMDFLKTQNIQNGMQKKHLDIELLEKNLRKKFNEVTWTSAKLEGTQLTIQIKENEVQENQGVKTYEASNLVASKEGVIVNMIVREGVPQVKIGQEIKQGDLLVAGNIPIYNEDTTIRKYQYCNADADIYVEYDLPYKTKLSSEYEKQSYSGREKNQYFIKIFGKTYKFSLGKIKYLFSDRITKESQLEILPNFFLPIIYGKTTYREYYLEELKYSDEEAKGILSDKYNKFIRSLNEKGVQIIEKDVKIEKDGLDYVLSGSFRVRERTGINSQIPIQEPETIESDRMEAEEQ